MVNHNFIHLYIGHMGSLWINLVNNNRMRTFTCMVFKWIDSSKFTIKYAAILNYIIFDPIKRKAFTYDYNYVLLHE